MSDTIRIYFKGDGKENLLMPPEMCYNHLMAYAECDGEIITHGTIWMPYNRNSVYPHRGALNANIHAFKMGAKGLLENRRSENALAKRAILEQAIVLYPAPLKPTKWATFSADENDAIWALEYIGQVGQIGTQAITIGGRFEISQDGLDIACYFHVSLGDISLGDLQGYFIDGKWSMLESE